MDHEYFDKALEIFKTLPHNPKANEQVMTILAYQNNNDQLTEFYDNLGNKDEYKEHYYSLTNNHKELVDSYKDRFAIATPTKSEVVSYAFSLLKTEDYNSVLSLLKPYYDNPQLTDGAIIVNYQFARLKCERNGTNKIKDKIKEKIFENKYIEYSDFEKLGAACIIGDKNEIVSYLSKIIKATPLDKYVVKDWPVLEPYLTDPRVQRILEPSVMNYEIERDVRSTH